MDKKKSKTTESKPTVKADDKLAKNAEGKAGANGVKSGSKPSVGAASKPISKPSVGTASKSVSKSAANVESKPSVKAEGKPEKDAMLSKDELLKGLGNLFADDEGDKTSSAKVGKYEVPQKSRMKKAIVDLLSQDPKKMWDRKDLIARSITMYGFPDSALSDNSCESLSTKLKSLTGVVINELVEEAVLTLDEDRSISLKVVPMSEAEIKEVFLNKYLTDDEKKYKKPEGKRNVLQAILGQIIKKMKEEGSLGGDGATVILEIESRLQKNERFRNTLLMKNKYPNTPIGKLLEKADDDAKRLKAGAIKPASYEIMLRSNLTQCISLAGGEFFEELSMKLIKTAYGGAVIKDELTAGPTDNGIDGKLTVKDSLGFTDLIFFQSKTKLKEKTHVSIKVVREFIGVVTAYNASKGILITNSNFAADTVKFVKNMPNIMLIDKMKLFKLMCDFSVGVVWDGNMPRIDEDMFLSRG